MDSLARPARSLGHAAGVGVLIDLARGQLRPAVGAVLVDVVDDDLAAGDRLAVQIAALDEHGAPVLADALVLADADRDPAWPPTTSTLGDAPDDGIAPDEAAQLFWSSSLSRARGPCPAVRLDARIGAGAGHAIVASTPSTSTVGGSGGTLPAQAACLAAPCRTGSSSSSAAFWSKFVAVARLDVIGHRGELPDRDLELAADRRRARRSVSTRRDQLVLAGVPAADA